MDNTKILFISHAEKDRAIVSHFVELLYHIGLKEENMFCSSRSEIGVPVREDIYDYLRSLLDSESVIPIFMLSDEYYRSPACLNEMGAVWIKQKDYFTFLLPGFEFKRIKGAININKRAIQLGNNTAALKNDLTIFKNEICNIFGHNISEIRWEKYRDNFLEDIKSIAVEKPIIKIRDVEGFCINQVDHSACGVTVDESINTVTARIDFSRTEAKLCSVVFYIGGIDFSWNLASNPRLQFSIKVQGDIRNISVETHLNSRNPHQLIAVSNQWTNYDLALHSFCVLDREWSNFKEICFVVNREDVKSGVIEIRDIKIVS